MSIDKIKNNILHNFLQNQNPSLLTAYIQLYFELILKAQKEWMKYTFYFSIISYHTPVGQEKTNKTHFAHT